jgi:redox-sensing transcriptional repressor
MASDLHRDIPRKTVGRLSVYRRVLGEVVARGESRIFSHELAARASVTAALVRRDLMSIGVTGSPARGYEIHVLSSRIAEVLEHPQGLRVALVGVGNLGRAILTFVHGRRAGLSVVAAFDRDPLKVGRVIHGCRCFAVSDLAAVCREQGVHAAVLTVPADQAQKVIDELVAAGVRGVLNFAPTTLKVPPGIHVQDMDITSTIEMVCYYALRGERAGGTEGR